MRFINDGIILLIPVKKKKKEVKFIAMVQILHICAVPPLGCSA